MDVSFEVPAEPSVLVQTALLKFPVARVWSAYTEPLYLQQWWGPHGYVNREVELDVTVGGTWRVIQSDPEGNTFAFYGRYSQVDTGALLAFTFTSEVFPDVLTWMRVDMDETAAGTAVVTTHRFPDDYHRRGYLHLGGIERMRESTERLEAFLRTFAR